jgi:SagB-type dehydrogenase family enzyme
MTNREIQTGWQYHNRTKHSPESVRRGSHFLDWANEPLPFKVYPRLEPIALPRDLEPMGTPSAAARELVPNLRQLASLLHFSAGITRRRRYSGGEIQFRAAACTGALYEIELYVVCGPLPDLPAGLYHFGPRDDALRRLREGDYRGVVAEAAACETSVVHAPLIVISTGTYWRNAWKYQARTYRHFGWDNGTIHANLLAMAAALALPCRLMCGFVDAEINRLLGLDTDREVALTLAAIGHTEAPAPPPIEITPLQLETVPLSRREVDYPEMRVMHAASSLENAEEVDAWRGATGPARSYAQPAKDFIPLAPLAKEQIPPDSIGEVILRRGSARRFRREAISFHQFSTILDRSTRGIPADFLGPEGARLNDLYIIVNAVDGVPPGAYYHNAGAGQLELLEHGDFRPRAAYLALEQDLAGDAAAAVFFLADLNHCFDRLGNRGYRAAQLEAGILGGKMYLAAYALRLGATGLTFYDDEVVEFFSPHAAGKSAIFLVAMGHPGQARMPVSTG